LLKAIGEYFCESTVVPSMVDAWAAAGTAPQKVVERVEATLGTPGARGTGKRTGGATGVV
jgi:galactokinase